MRAASHQQRLEQLREQNRTWAGPVCDVSLLPRFEGGARMRAEWDTRGTINNRFWADTMSAGAKQVTSEMLAAHPTQGSWEGNPTDSRKDRRQWTAASAVSSTAGVAAKAYGVAPEYFPDEKEPGQRPVLPESSLWLNPHFDGWNPESIDTMREMRHIVKESNRWTVEDSSLRVQQRTFQHQWLPAQGVAQLEAAEKLRPMQDNFREDIPVQHL